MQNSQNPKIRLSKELSRENPYQTSILCSSQENDDYRKVTFSGSFFPLFRALHKPENQETNELTMFVSAKVLSMDLPFKTNTSDEFFRLMERIRAKIIENFRTEIFEPKILYVPDFKTFEKKWEQIFSAGIIPIRIKQTDKLTIINKKGDLRIGNFGDDWDQITKFGRWSGSFILDSVTHNSNDESFGFKFIIAPNTLPIYWERENEDILETLSEEDKKVYKTLFK